MAAAVDQFQVQRIQTLGLFCYGFQSWTPLPEKACWACMLPNVRRPVTCVVHPLDNGKMQLQTWAVAIIRSILDGVGVTFHSHCSSLSILLSTYTITAISDTRY